MALNRKGFTSEPGLARRRLVASERRGLRTPEIVDSNPTPVSKSKGAACYHGRSVMSIFVPSTMKQRLPTILARTHRGFPARIRNAYVLSSQFLERLPKLPGILLRPTSRGQ